VIASFCLEFADKILLFAVIKRRHGSYNKDKLNPVLFKSLVYKQAEHA